MPGQAITCQNASYLNLPFVSKHLVSLASLEQSNLSARSTLLTWSYTASSLSSSAILDVT